MNVSICALLNTKENPMKKYITLFLLTACLLASCSSAPAENETEAMPQETEDTIAAETEAEAAPPQPGNVEVFEYHTLTLDRDPVYENGVFVLYFTESDIWYEPDADFRIGIRSSEEAYTIAATVETEAYPDMAVEDEYCGIALKPVEEIPAGEYRFSVTFEEYICDFELTIE